MGILTGLFSSGASGLANAASSIIKDFKLDPTVEAQLNEKLKEAIMTHQETMGQQAEETMKTVNETMQVEAKSEHFLQWSWRPIFGFTCAGTIINNYIIMPYFSQVKAITIPNDVWMVMLTVLGVAAATRGGDKNLLSDINFTKK